MHFLTKITAYPSARLAVDFHHPLQNVFNLKLNWMVDIQKNYLKKVTTVFLFLLCQCTPFVPSNKPLTSAVISYNYSYNHTNSLWLLQNFNRGWRFVYTEYFWDNWSYKNDTTWTSAWYSDNTQPRPQIFGYSNKIYFCQIKFHLLEQMKPDLISKLKTGCAAVEELATLLVLVCGFTSKKRNTSKKKHDSARVVWYLMCKTNTSQRRWQVTASSRSLLVINPALPP